MSRLGKEVVLEVGGSARSDVGDVAALSPGSADREGGNHPDPPCTSMQHCALTL